MVWKKVAFSMQISSYLPLFAGQEAPGEAASRAHFSNKKQLFEQQ